MCGSEKRIKLERVAHSNKDRRKKLYLHVTNP